jgi:hypothetical protein
MANIAASSRASSGDYGQAQPIWPVSIESDGNSHNPVTINLAETASSRCARLVDDTVYDETPQVKAVPDPRARDN